MDQGHQKQRNNRLALIIRLRLDIDQNLRRAAKVADAERRKIQIHIVMDESGAFVVDDDPDVAAERAEEALGEDADVRQIALSLEILPPSQSSAPVTVTCKID